MAFSSFTVEDLSRYKLNETDENLNIAMIVRQLLPAWEGGLILDVGAGLGDIAANAFPERDALLIDILDFPGNGCPKHVRRQVDFFKFHSSNGVAIDAMLMSHVLQYIDDDLERLRAKTLELNPRNLIVVVDQPDRFQADIFRWFRQHDIPYNAEKPLPGFPPEGFVLKQRVDIQGSIYASDFDILANRLGRLIFDAQMTDDQCSSLTGWLRERLAQPTVTIPQAVELYARQEKSRV